MILLTSLPFGQQISYCLHAVGDQGHRILGSLVAIGDLHVMATDIGENKMIRDRQIHPPQIAKSAAERGSHTELTNAACVINHCTTEARLASV